MKSNQKKEGSFLSKNISKSTLEEKPSESKIKTNPKVFIVQKKKKKLKISKKRKQPYRYHTSKLTKDHSKVTIEDKPTILFDNYYMRNESILSTEQIILASSWKKGAVTVEPFQNDSSPIETCRIRNSVSKVETEFRSATSIIANEETKNLFNSKRKKFSNTPGDVQKRSSVNLKKIRSSYSSKRGRRVNNIISHWSHSLKVLPKQARKYSQIKNKEMLVKAYKIISKQTVNNKKNKGFQKTNWSRKRRGIPMSNNPSKEDQTLWLLLKHLKQTESRKLPKVTVRTDHNGSSIFLNNKKFIQKNVRIF